MLNPKSLMPDNEQHEVFFAGIGRKQKKMVQYDYRAEDGELFSCIRLTLGECRRARNDWALKRKKDE